MPMWPSIVKGSVKKKSQFGAEGNELENALAKQWLEPIMNTKSKTAANKICSFLKEPAKAAFQNDSPAHTPSTCSKTVHLVAPWCCHRIEPLLWVAACDVFWVSWYFSMWLGHGACQQLTIALVICTERGKKCLWVAQARQPGQVPEDLQGRLNNWTVSRWLGANTSLPLSTAIDTGASAYLVLNFIVLLGAGFWEEKQTSTTSAQMKIEGHFLLNKQTSIRYLI